MLAGSKDAARCIGYLTKYITKHVADCHQADTDAQRAHADLLAAALRFEPCSQAGGVMAARRRFGRVRRLPSGRYQARYLGPDGVDRPAPGTFASKTSAEKWLVGKEAEIQDDQWLDPDLGRVTFGDYALAWVRERPSLRPNTKQVYRYVLARHLLPFFGNRPVADIKETHIRRWRHELLDSGDSPASVAQLLPSGQGNHEHCRRGTDE